VVVVIVLLHPVVPAVPHIAIYYFFNQAFVYQVIASTGTESYGSAFAKHTILFLLC
jgi:hypothetical protein